jgi:hypothetical protein
MILPMLAKAKPAGLRLGPSLAQMPAKSWIESLDDTSWTDLVW